MPKPSQERLTANAHTTRIRASRVVVCCALAVIIGVIGEFIVFEKLADKVNWAQLTATIAEARHIVSELDSLVPIDPSVIIRKAEVLQKIEKSGSAPHMLFIWAASIVGTLVVYLSGFYYGSRRIIRWSNVAQLRVISTVFAIWTIWWTAICIETHYGFDFPVISPPIASHKFIYGDTYIGIGKEYGLATLSFVKAWTFALRVLSSPCAFLCLLSAYSIVCGSKRSNDGENLQRRFRDLLVLGFIGSLLLTTATASVALWGRWYAELSKTLTEAALLRQRGNGIGLYFGFIYTLMLSVAFVPIATEVIRRIPRQSSIPSDKDQALQPASGLALPPDLVPTELYPALAPLATVLFPLLLGLLQGVF